MIIKNNGNYIRYVNGVMLAPGTNQLNKQQAKAFNDGIKANRLDAFLVDKGELQSLRAKSGKDIVAVSDMTAEQAKSAIADTASIKTLTGWLADEKRSANRKSVVDALNVKLTEMQEPTE